MVGVERMRVPELEAKSWEVATACSRLAASSCRRASSAERWRSSAMPSDASPSMARWSPTAASRHMSSVSWLERASADLRSRAWARLLARRMRCIERR
eukprot:862388-Heterocapsa_arctica.AAC.1